MPLVTQKAPKFDATAVVGQEIVQLEWDKLHENKWLVLFFYPLDFTFVCPTEIVAFSDATSKFTEIGAKNTATLGAVHMGFMDDQSQWVIYTFPKCNFLATGPNPGGGGAVSGTLNFGGMRLSKNARAAIYQQIDAS